MYCCVFKFLDPTSEELELDSCKLNDSYPSNINTFLIQATSTPNTSTVHSNATKERLTVCLTCGMSVCGPHAEVSYCFSEEHMCEGLNQNQQQFLEAIAILCNVMYIGHDQSENPPFNPSNIQSSLESIFSQHQEVQNADSSLVLSAAESLARSDASADGSALLPADDTK